MAYLRFGDKNPFYGKHHTDEARKRMSELKKGKSLSEEHRKKIGQGLFCGTIEERFLSKIKKTKNCWFWLGSLRKGKMKYGRFAVSHRKNVIAHRFSYELYKGKIPDGLLVLHSCDNPSCVKPGHLFIGTQKDNMQDMVKKGRGKNGSGYY